LDDWNGKYNLWNAYGPTESTVCVIVHKFKKGDQIVLGKALHKNELSICNEELIVKGNQVAVGHISTDGITLYNGVYNTGDIVSLNENNDFIFRGRKDDQIKIRGGYRVSLQEIKKTIESLEKIECVYILPYSSGDTNEMCCFFDGKLEEKELRESVAGILPHHMIPSKFIHIEKWPLNGSDKIDRNKLSEMISISPTEVVHFDITQLVRLWKEVLNVDSLDENSNFFQLGGQSFQALQIIQEYVKSFGLPMELIDFFKNPTPIEQVAFLRKNNQIKWSEHVKCCCNRKNSGK
jgi:acyl carrier protein